MTPTAWPDLSAHDQAFQQAKHELGDNAPLSHLLMRAAQVLHSHQHTNCDCLTCRDRRDYGKARA